MDPFECLQCAKLNWKKGQTPRSLAGKNEAEQHYQDKHPLTVRKKIKCSGCNQSFDTKAEKELHQCPLAPELIWEFAA